MTSINAMKFDEYTGACIFDEERGWNDEGMKMNLVEKMRPVSPGKVTDETGLVAVYGNTGTSTIGDELRFSIQKRIEAEYEKARAAAGGPAKGFLTIPEVGRLAYDVITDLKHTHIDQELVGRYGFTTKDFVAGSYTADGQKIDIKDADLVKKVDELTTWKARSQAPMSVFLNGGIIAGYEPSEGFHIMRVDMIEHVCEPVQAAFLADGSGRDMCNVAFTEYANDLTVPARRGQIDRVEGMMEMISALNLSIVHNIGVSGYTNIICIDGQKKKNADKLWLINDHRCKLASEIVRAKDGGHLSVAKAGDLIEGIVFEGASFVDTEEAFLKAHPDPKTLVRFLRGYRV